MSPIRKYDSFPDALTVACSFISSWRKTDISTVSSAPRTYSEDGSIFNFFAIERFCLVVFNGLAVEALGGDVSFGTAVRTTDLPHPGWERQEIKESRIKHKRDVDLPVLIAFLYAILI